MVTPRVPPSMTLASGHVISARDGYIVLHTSTSRRSSRRWHNIADATEAGLMFTIGQFAESITDVHLLLALYHHPNFPRT